MPCIEWLEEHKNVNYFGYQPTFHPEAPFREWCGVPVALHLHVSKTQTFPTNAANEIYKSWDWVQGSVTVSDPLIPIFNPPKDVEPPQEVFVPLPAFPLDLELPPPIYGGINCGSEPGPPGPPGEDGEVNIESMIEAVEDADETQKRNFSLSAGFVSMSAPELICNVMGITSPETNQCVGQILMQETPFFFDTAETRVEDGPLHLTIEQGAQGEARHVLHVPTNLGDDDMEMIEYQDQEVRCDVNGRFEVIDVQRFAIAQHSGGTPGVTNSDAAWRQSITEMLITLLHCCNPCLTSEPYVEWDIAEPAWFSVELLERVEIQLLATDIQLITQFGNPNVMKMAKFTWLSDADFKAGEELFVNYDKQIFVAPKDKHVSGFAVIPASQTGLRVRLWGTPPPNIETTSPHLEPLRS